MYKNYKNKYIPVQKFMVTDDFINSRLDNCLISKLKGLPKSKIYSIIRKGEVRVNGSRCKPYKKLLEGDVVRVPPYISVDKPPIYLHQQLKNVLMDNIIYDEESILVINKPVGLASHGGSGVSLGLIEAVRKIDIKYRNAQLVHRLDKETSGCIVLALKRPILRKLNKELREGRVIKKYLAVVNGKWPEDLRIVESNLKKNQLRSGEREVQINSSGKKSITKFKILKSNHKLSLLECNLLTGRTHQIRVQTSNKGYPILGDKKYGDPIINKTYKLKGVDRMLLHAKSISFPEIKLFYTAEEPDIFIKTVD